MARSLEEARVLHVGAQGRTVIPAAFRRKMGLREGDELVAWLEDDRLIISSRRTVAANTRGLLKRLGGDPDRSLVDELIAERRAEALREDSESEALKRPSDKRQRRESGT